MSTEIVNLSLRHLGSSNEVANYLTERSAEARAARAFFDISKQTTFRDANWPFARKTLNLSLVSTNTTREWMYSYRYPVDCLKLRGLILPNFVDESIVTPSGYRIPFVEESDASGLLILTNMMDAKAMITKEVPVTMWPPDFKLTMSYFLASLMAPSITGGDPFKLGDKCMGLYTAWLDKAEVNSFNEEFSADTGRASELETSRL